MCPSDDLRGVEGRLLGPMEEVPIELRLAVGRHLHARLEGMIKDDVLSRVRVARLEGVGGVWVDGLDDDTHLR